MTSGVTSTRRGDPQGAGQVVVAAAHETRRTALLAAGARLGYPRLALAWNRETRGRAVPYLWLMAGEMTWRHFAGVATHEEVALALVAVTRQEAF